MRTANLYLGTWNANPTAAHRELGVRAARFARNVLLLAAAPFVGLAYVLAAPFVGIAALAWFAVRAAAAKAT